MIKDVKILNIPFQEKTIKKTFKKGCVYYCEMSDFILVYEKNLSPECPHIHVFSTIAEGTKIFCLRSAHLEKIIEIGEL